jgi:uncharacterized protein (DUF2225 family)
MGLDDKLVRKKLEVLLKDDSLVDMYLRTYGPRLDMNYISKVKQAHVKSMEGESGDINDPTYQIKVKCPICNQNDLLCFELKAKSLSVVPDRFMAPRYAGVKGFKGINYSLIAVTVCPSCLFASPDKKDFITFSVQAKSETKSQLSPFVLDELRQKVEERKMLVSSAPDFTTFFKHPRGVEAAIASYRLAIHRSLVEATLDTPLAWYKAGMYGLKIAVLLRDAGKPDDAILKESLDYLTKSFTNSELKAPEMEYQLVYTIAALALRLGDGEKCQAYISTLEKWLIELSKKAKEDPKISTGHLEKWITKVKDLWTDRETPDVWRH